jgi:hypothetical protein
MVAGVALMDDRSSPKTDCREELPAVAGGGGRAPLSHRDATPLFELSRSAGGSGSFFSRRVRQIAGCCVLGRRGAESAAPSVDFEQEGEGEGAMHMSRFVLSSAIAAALLGTTSCATWNAMVRRNGYGTNPDVAETVRTDARPASALAVLSCWDDPSFAGRDAADRKQFETAALPELWKGMGGTGAARHERANGDLETVCDDLQDKLIRNPGWKVGAATKQWIAKEAPADAKSVIFAYYSFPPRCTSQDETVRDSTGKVVATIDTHEKKCVENGLATMRIVWTRLDGTVLGKIEDSCDNSGGRCGTDYEKTGDEVSYLMGFLGPEKK